MAILLVRHSRKLRYYGDVIHALTLGAHARSEGYCSCRVCVCVCVCMYVCVCVCMYVCVCPLITAASHIGITKQRYQRVHSNTEIVLNFPKNASFKSYGVICLPRAAPASYSFFHHEISFYASVKPIATFSLHRQQACGRQRAIRWHRLVKRHGYTDHEY